jgi:hypothetical protein
MIGASMEAMQAGGFVSPTELMCFTFNVSFVPHGTFVIPQCSKYA